jgi:hypothetical protein
MAPDKPVGSPRSFAGRPGAAAGPPGPRILLLEFVNDDIFNQHRAETFPFLFGDLKERGIAVEWLSMPAGRSMRAGNPWVIEPQPDVREPLVAAAHAFQPTHLVANDLLGDLLVAALRDRLPDLRVVPLDLDLLRHGRLRSLAEFVGGTDAAAFGDLDGSLFQRACPDYGARLIGRMPPGPAQLVPLFGGPSCVYRRSLSGNPHFEGVVLEGVAFPRGCSFCVNPDEPATREPGWDPVASAVLQLRRFQETAPAFRRTDRYLVRGIRVFQRLPDFLAKVIAMGLPPSAFFFSCRVDELLARADDLRTWVPRMAANGHSVHFWNVGLENFSPTENERFNKGVSPRQAQDALALLDGLEAQHPTAFGFRRHGGFGLILFTPWTRPQDLEINVRALRQHGDRGDLGPLTSRLQLRPGTALEALARRDGLIDDRAALPEVPRELSCLTEPGDREIPWRFADADVGAIWSVLAGWYLSSPSGGADDVPQAACLDALECLLETVRDAPGMDAEPLRRVVAARLAGRLVRADPGQESPPAVTWINGIRRVLERTAAAAPEAFDGFALEHVRATADGETTCAEVAFRHADERFVLEVRPGRQGEAFLHAGGYRICYRPDSPIDSERRERVARLLAGVIEWYEAAVGRLAREGATCPRPSGRRRSPPRS